MANSQRCPCGSRKLYSNCCEKYFGKIKLLGANPKDTIFLEWLKQYTPPLSQEFMRKGRTYIFRISWLLDNVLERYFDFPMVQKNGGLEAREDPICWIEHGTLLSLLGALSCLVQGLFVQSGILLRSVMENCMVLVDLSENEVQMEKMLKGTYSANKVVGRVKKLLPDSIISWYGYFSTNYAHFGPIHPAPYLPRKCWPDNWVFVTGIQNILRGCVTLGIVLERLHFVESKEPIFWELDPKIGDLTFNEEGFIWEWIEELGKEVVAKYPPNERKEGFTYSGGKYKLK